MKEHKEEHKVIITRRQETINDYIKDGWLVKNVTSQYVSNGSSGAVYGNFLIVFYRPI